MQDELIHAAMRGSESAYHDLFELWYSKAYRIGKSICGSKGLAEDAVQEALVRFWRALPRLRQPSLAEGYFLRVVANEARRLHRKKTARSEELLDSTSGSSTEGIEADVTGREQSAELLKAVDTLPEKLRSAVKLHYYGEFTEARTAQLLGISLSSVKMRLARGRGKMKTMLEQAGYTVERGN